MTSLDYLTEKEVAKIRRCSLSTLRQERHRGEGCPYFKINRSVLYRRDEVIKFIEQRRIETSESMG